jgi:hypothetical protein
MVAVGQCFTLNYQVNVQMGDCIISTKYTATKIIKFESQ